MWRSARDSVCVVGQAARLPAHECLLLLLVLTHAITGPVSVQCALLQTRSDGNVRRAQATSMRMTYIKCCFTSREM